MVTTDLALSNAWTDVLAGLNVDSERSIILGGPLAERLGAAVPYAVVDEVAGLVSLGAGPILDAEATVVEARLPDSSVDTVIMVDAWRSPAELSAVVAEAKRICTPGGAVSLASLDIERLVHATPSVRTSALFFGSYGRSLGLEEQIDTPVAATELALQRSGFDDLESWPTELPIAAFASEDDYVAAVALGMWPGVELLSRKAWLALEEEIRATLSLQDEPYIEWQPWLLATGVLPS